VAYVILYVAQPDLIADLVRDAFGSLRMGIFRSTFVVVRRVCSVIRISHVPWSRVVRQPVDGDDGGG
jgi:hypothetical protein